MIATYLTDHKEGLGNHEFDDLILSSSSPCHPSPSSPPPLLPFPSIFTLSCLCPCPSQGSAGPPVDLEGVALTEEQRQRCRGGLDEPQMRMLKAQVGPALLAQAVRSSSLRAKR